MEAKLILNFERVRMSFEIVYQLQVLAKGHLINCAGLGKLEIVDSFENPGLPGVNVLVQFRKDIESAILSMKDNDPRELMRTFGWEQRMYSKL